MEHKNAIIQILSDLNKKLTADRKLLKSLPRGNLVQTVQHGKAYLTQTRYTNGKRFRTSLSKRPQIVSGLIKAHFIRSEIAVLEADIHELQRLLSKLSCKTRTDIIFELQQKYSLIDKSFIASAVSESADDGWSQEPYEQLEYKNETKNHITSRGLKVRSKSELIIAELLYSFGIPFRYDQVLYIGNSKIAPDFTIKRSDGKIFYWEHCGLMTDPEYRNHQLQKTRLYYSEDIGPWDNLIVTYDENGFVNASEIEHIIRTKLVI